MAERQFGPYRLVRQIAVGGMAEIYLARTAVAGGGERFVALKMIHPNFAEDDQFIDMLIDEARISIQLHHPNIAHTFDLGRYGETYYLIMEFVDGADLYKILRRGSERDVVTPIDVAAYVVKEVAHGLDYAHRRADEHGQPLSIVHRDVSPQNVIVSYDGAIKLVDFGIAKAASKAQQTAAGVIKGKYYYMSPEQALGEPLDHRTDVFSAGIVLYELLSGQMLYLEEDVNRLLDRVRRADIPSVRTLRRDVPSQLDRILSRALARRREERYPYASDLAADLERFLDMYSPAFTTRKLSQYVVDALGDQAQPFLPSTSLGPPPTPAPRRTGGAARSPQVSMPEEFTDENSMIFRVADLEPGPRAKAPPARRPPAPRAPAPRAADQRTAPIESHLDGDEVDSTLVSSRPPREQARDRGHDPTGDQTADEPETSAAGPRGVRKAAVAPRAPAPSLDMGDYEPTVIESAPPAGVPASAAGRHEPAQTHAQAHAADADDDGPTFTRDASPMVPVGEVAATARARRPQVQQPAALAASTPAPDTSPVRKRGESRRTPPGGTGAPSVLQAIVGQPAPPHPRPVRGAGAPLSDGVPAPVPEPPGRGVPSSPARGAPPVPPGRGLQLGVQAGSLDPSFDAPTSPGALPVGVLGPSPGPTPAAPVPPAPPPPSGPWPGAAETWPGAAETYPPQQPAPQPGEVPVYPFPQGQPPQGYPSVSRQLMAIELDEIPPQYRIKRSGSSVALIGALAAVVVLGITAAIVLVVRGGGDSARPRPSIYLDSSPAGESVLIDGVVLPEKTPTVYRETAPGKRHDVELRLPGHKTVHDAVLMPDDGGDVRFSVPMVARTVSLVVRTTPPGADVLIDDHLEGTTAPTVGLTVVDISPARPTVVEVRLKGHAPKIERVEWTDADEQKTLDFTFGK